MSKRLNAHMQWLESIGYSPFVWLRGDWHQPLHLLSKLLADELNKRRPMNSTDDVTFKIGFNSMLQLAEEILGIPCFITEKDLMIHYPNIILAMLVYLVCVKHSVDFIDTKSLRSIVAPKLVFEARNGGDAQLPRCESCSEHVFIIERVVVEACVWHRHCFKCVQCNATMRAGGFRKSKRGYKCIIHAVRRILDIPRERRCNRPQVAPPEVPSTNLVSIESDSKTNTLKRRSVPSPVSPKPKLPPYPKQKPSPPPKPAGLSLSKEHRKTTVIKESKPSELTSDYEIVSFGSDKSGDSGVVMRPQNLVVDADAEGYEVVSELHSTSRSAVACETNSPVPPPRPKRASVLITSVGIEPKSATDTPSTSVPIVAEKSATSAPEMTPSSSRDKSNSRCTSSWLVMEGSADRSSSVVDSDEVFNDELKNPFADSEDEYEASTAPSGSRLLTQASALPGDSDRPKSTPPPPPPMSCSFSDKTLKNPVSMEERFRTLRVFNKLRTLHPPIAMRGKVKFTENSALGDTNEIIKKLERLDVDMERIMREGKQLEVEMLFLITQNPSDWLKMPRTEDFIEVLCKFLDVIRESNTLQFMWRETFLNEMHSETECFLRRIIFKDSQDEESTKREKQLMNLLIFIIDEKAKLSERNLDGRAKDTAAMQKKELKKLRHSLLMILLSKKK